MRLLLDTHVALWAVSEPDRLDPVVQGWLIDPANVVAVSAVNLWEIAIKRSVRSSNADRPRLSPTAAEQAFQDAEFDMAEIAARHFDHVEQLPFYHRDPFDRLLISLAIVDGYQLLTRDGPLAAYGAHVILV